MEVTQRFLKYVSFDTTSSETSDTVPTTAHQRVLGQYLADELAALERSVLSLHSLPMSNVPDRIIGMAWRSPDSIILIHLGSAAASLETG